MKFLALILIIPVMYSCAHHKDVRPGAEGVHRVVVQNETTKGASESALSQAKDYCEDVHKKSAAILTETSKYVGTVDEKTYQTGKAVSSVLKTVGSGAYVFGGKNESNAGGVAVLGGAATDAAFGEGYIVEMTFKCQ